MTIRSPVRRAHRARCALRLPVTLGTALTLIAATGSAVSPGPSRSAEPARTELLQVADDWFELLLETDPFYATEIGDHRFDDRFDLSIAPAVRQRLASGIDRLAARLSKVERALLDPEDRLTAELLERRLAAARAGLSFPEHLLPVTSMPTMAPLRLVQLASPTGAQPFATVQDHEHFLSRMSGLVDWVELAIANLRLGAAGGIVQPCRVTRAAIGRLATLVVDRPESSPLFQPARRLPDGLRAEERRQIEERYRQLLSERVIPGYRRLVEFLVAEYEPRCRRSLSLSELPQGEAWYRHRVREATGSELSPQEILRLGQEEARRILAEMASLAAELGHEDLATAYRQAETGPGAALGSPQEVLDVFGQLRRRVDQRLPELFSQSPATELELRVVPPEERAWVVGESYTPALPDGSRPGVFWISYRDPYPTMRMEALFLHEAVPGHHYQLSLARGAVGLPRFRRFGFEGAYVEGWGLYAEGLGEALGLYRDPRQRLGRLSMELLRAARLVLDTGIHMGGWGEEEATRVSTEQFLGSGSWEIGRYAALPGQALGYKVGELGFWRLRGEAEHALGDDFDLREFHHQLLRHGPLPLDLLEQEVRRWLTEVAPTPLSPARGRRGLPP